MFHTNISLMPNDWHANKIPWIVFYSVSWKPFYVDILHAINIQTREKLERILNIESESDFEYEVNKLCFTPLMKKTYTIYDVLLTQPNTKSRRLWVINYTKNKILFLYYYTLSPKLVPLQFKYPSFNRLLYKSVDITSDVLLNILGQKVLNDDQIYDTKIKGAKRKMMYASWDTQRDYRSYWADYEKKVNFFDRFNKERDAIE